MLPSHHTGVFTIVPILKNFKNTEVIKRDFIQSFAKSEVETESYNASKKNSLTLYI